MRLSVVSSHVHPEAIDGAYVIAKANALLCQETPATFDPVLFLSALEGSHSSAVVGVSDIPAAIASTHVIRQRLGFLADMIHKLKKGEDVEDEQVLKEVCDVRTLQLQLWYLASFFRNRISKSRRVMRYRARCGLWLDMGMTHTPALSKRSTLVAIQTQLAALV